MRSKQGMALVAVLWLVAALSVMVSGLIWAARVQVRTAATDGEQVLAAGIADAAINLAAREILEKPEDHRRYKVVVSEIGGRRVEIEFAPLVGLISLNRAQEGLLADMFEVAGGKSPADAKILAERVLDWRSPGDSPLPEGAKNEQYQAAGSLFSTRGSSGFDVEEDLLQVLGMDYDLYDRIAPLVSADALVSAQVSPLAAPVSVLTVLTKGDAAAAGAYATERDTGSSTMDTGHFTAAHIGQSASSLYRLTVRVHGSAGRAWDKRAVIDTTADIPGQYWQVLRESPLRGAPVSTGAMRQD